MTLTITQPGPAAARRLALVLLSLAPGLAAPDDDPAHEPAPAPEHGKLATADATPVDPGALEIETAYAGSWMLPGAGGLDDVPDAHVHGLGLAVTYGVRDGLDVAASLGWASAYDAGWDHDPSDGIAGPARGRGLTDLEVGARWRFLHRERRLELAVRGAVVAPIGTPCSVDRVGVSQEHWSGDLALVATRDLGPFTGNAELGVSVPFGARRGDARGAVFANLAVGWQALPWLQPELELNAERAWNAGATPDPELLAVTAAVVAPFGAGYRIVAGAQLAAWGRHTGRFAAATVAFKWAY